MASALGHGSFAVTAKHYVDPDTLINSGVRRIAGALTNRLDDDTARLLERLRALSPEARNSLLRALAAATGN